MRPLPHPAAWLVGAVAVAVTLTIFALLHAHGIVHFAAHLPGVDALIHRIGWDKARGIYWHLRHLIP